MTKPINNTHGVALVIVLIFLVLISILVVGFLSSMRNDLPSAGSHLDRTMAGQFAQMGIETVVSTLQTVTADPNRYWLTQPGQIWTGAMSDNPGTAADERKVIQNSPQLLFSGSSGTGTPSKDYFAPANLNIATLRDPTTRLLTDRPDPVNPSNPLKMNVRWIYVRNDGQLDQSEEPVTTDKTNPIVGRFAYWTDDESSKINYNLAWGRGSANTRPQSDLTKVDLSVLTDMSPAMADTLRNFITGSINYATLNKGFFNTPADARKIAQEPGGDAIAKALEENKFEVTHFSHDPDTTFFNDPRIVLTTRPDRAGWTYNSATGKWEGGRPYLQILKNEGTTVQPDYIPQKTNRPSQLASASPSFTVNDPLDPGFVSNLDDTRVSNTLYFLMSYLQRTDWPMVSGTGSFQSKYYSGYPVPSSRLAQLAINIIDYVRSKESSADFVDPLRVSRSSSADAPKFTIQSQFTTIPGTSQTAPFTPASTPPAFSIGNSATTESFIGLTRAPMLTELGVWMAADKKSEELLFELYLPRNYGIDKIDLSTMYIGTQCYTSNATSLSTMDAQDQINKDALTNGNVPSLNQIRIRDGQIGTGTGGVPITELDAGKYVTVIRYKDRVFSTRPTGLLLRAFIGSWGAQPVIGRWYCDMATAINDSSHGSLIPYTVDSAVGSVAAGADASTADFSNLTSVEVDDPRVNKSNGNWRQDVAHSFGAANSLSSLKTPNAPTVDPTTQPGQDVDGNGKIDPSSSLYMPPPAGRTFTLSNGQLDDNTRGTVSSIGELGYIHTGIEASPSGSGPTGVPWRTFRLQPNRQGNDVVPDWALMDLFTVPSTVPSNAKEIFTPHTTSQGGRINLNSKAEPFDLERTLPLRAVFNNAFTGSTNLSASAAATIADNIHNHVLAANGKISPSPSYYISPGQVVEIKGVADSGEASEALVRETANLLTARGEVMSIYTVGQTIKQTPAGSLQVTAEQRLQAMVERYRDPTTQQINFSTVYWHPLVP